MTGNSITHKRDATRRFFLMAVQGIAFAAIVWGGIVGMFLVL